MPAQSPPLDPALTQQAQALGARIRAARKQQRTAAATAAQAAGMSRSTWHRIEAGEPSVTLGAFLAALAAVGLRATLDGSQAPPEPPSAFPFRLGDHPGLRALAWQLGDDTVLSQVQLRELLDRQGRHLEEGSLTDTERRLVALARSADV